MIFPWRRVGGVWRVHTIHVASGYESDIILHREPVAGKQWARFFDYDNDPENYSIVRDHRTDKPVTTLKAAKEEAAWWLEQEGYIPFEEVEG